MNFLKFVYFSVVLIFVVSMTSCSRSEAPQSSSTNVSYNASFNSNANYYKRPMENTNMSTNMRLPVPVNNETLADALKNRLRRDKEEILAPQDWERPAWLDLRIGLFYKDDDEFIRDAVCDVTEDLLEPHNQRMTRNSQKRLRGGVGRESKCRAVVARMLEASLSTESIESIP